MLARVSSSPAVVRTVGVRVCRRTGIGRIARVVAPESPSPRAVVAGVVVARGAVIAGAGILREVGAGSSSPPSPRTVVAGVSAPPPPESCESSGGSGPL